MCVGIYGTGAPRTIVPFAVEIIDGTPDSVVRAGPNARARLIPVPHLGAKESYLGSKWA
jgi:hypothetical protein